MTIIQPLPPQDALPVAAMRHAASAHKGEKLGPEARPVFDAMFAATPAAADVRVEPATVGGIPGFWLRPDRARPRAVILYVHGGGYVLGSAQAVTNFAGQIAARVGADTFVPDYRLAPEHPFPAAIDDIAAAYRGLVAEGAERIVIAGDFGRRRSDAGAAVNPRSRKDEGDPATGRRGRDVALDRLGAHRGQFRKAAPRRTPSSRAACFRPSPKPTYRVKMSLIPGRRRSTRNSPTCRRSASMLAMMRFCSTTRFVTPTGLGRQAWM